MTDERLKEMEAEAKDRISPRGAYILELIAEIRRLRDRHLPGCNVLLDDESDQVLDSYQQCTCDYIELKKDMARARAAALEEGAKIALAADGGDTCTGTRIAETIRARKDEP